MSPSSPPDLSDAATALPDAPARLRPGVRERVVAHALAADIARIHGEALLRTARRYSQCADDAHDAYQRAMELLLAHASTIDRAKAVAWMHVVVRREAAAIRRQGTQTVPLEDDDVDELLHRTVSVPEEHVHAIDLAQRAGEALATLKEAEAQALCLRAQGLSYDEIADVYGWTYSKVNRAVTEGRKAFVEHYTAVESGVVCGYTSGLMSRYVEGTLTPRVALKLRVHMVRCSGCRALLHAERQADTALRALLPPAFVALASERTGRTSGWLHDHLLGPIGHAAGRLQPAAEQVVGSKLGLVAASTLALAAGGVAVEQGVVRDPAPPPALRPGLTAPAPATTLAASAPPSGALVRVVGSAVDNGRATAARVEQRAAATAARKRRTVQRKKAAAKARRLANAREFAGGVSEFDATTRASAGRSAGTAAAGSGTSSGTPSSSGGGDASSVSAPVTEVPADAGGGGSTVDVVTEESVSPGPPGGGGSGGFGD